MTVLELEKSKRNHIKADILAPPENINISITFIRGTYPSLHLAEANYLVFGILILNLL